MISHNVASHPPRCTFFFFFFIRTDISKVYVKNFQDDQPLQQSTKHRGFLELICTITLGPRSSDSFCFFETAVEALQNNAPLQNHQQQNNMYRLTHTL